MASNLALSDELSEISMYVAPFVAVSAMGLGLAAIAGAGPRTLQRHPFVAAAIACGGTVMLAKSQFDRFFTEQPPYEVVDRLNGIEIRRYAPRVVAETRVATTSFDDAREEGFRRLASYIFGENAARKKRAPNASQSLALDDEPPNEKLPMTTPVTLAASEGGYVMRFLMPRERKLATLPQPKDPRVVLRRLPLENFAVLRFRGTYAPERIEAKERELVERVEAAGLQPKGEPSFAGYDSPAALPFLRRVEVWIGLA